MIKEIIESPTSFNGLVFSRVHGVFYPDHLNLDDWDGSRDVFDFLDGWINAVAQRFHQDTTGQDWFDVMNEDQRKIYFDKISDVIMTQIRSHRTDPKDIFSEVRWDDDYESVRILLINSNVI